MLTVGAILSSTLTVLSSPTFLPSVILIKMMSPCSSPSIFPPFATLFQLSSPSFCHSISYSVFVLTCTLALPASHSISPMLIAPSGITTPLISPSISLLRFFSPSASSPAAWFILSPASSALSIIPSWMK